MRNIELFTTDNHYVATVEVLPFPDKGMPRVVIWGERTFLWDPSTYEYGDRPWRYHECFASVSLTPSPGLDRWQPTPPPPVDHSQRAISGTGETREPDTTLRADGQQREYVVLSVDERAKGLVRPVRRTYRHLKCGTTTTMSQDIAETYARDPKFYSGTFCVGCGGHFPVGAAGEFVWDHTDEKVGT